MSTAEPIALVVMHARALETTFPKEKRREEVLAQSAGLIVAYLFENLQAKPDTLTGAAYLTLLDHELVSWAARLDLTGAPHGWPQTCRRRARRRWRSATSG
jgi:hypothetical protein